MAEATRGRGVRRVAALVVVAMACVLTGSGAAWAWWRATATAEAPSNRLAAGTVDVQVAGLGSELVGRGGTVSLPALALTGAMPGAGDSELVTVRNAGSRPATVTATTARTGTLGTSFAATASFGATDTGNGCSTGAGGTATVPARGSVSLCVAVSLATNAPSTTQGQSGGVSVALRAALPGTSWDDTGTMLSGAVGAATVPAPTLTCGLLGIASVTFNWTAVPSATRYRFGYGPGGNTPVEVAAGTTMYQVTGQATNATARVRAERVFSTGTAWNSAWSNTRRYTITLGLLGTCS
ncbi:hypothetical protein AAG589_03440 [Isoptericola sp. F-RaC21]|uniref:hypothetical protein n=1 Tax=Isoptericola sp. F-RaC21 TaxID=3141452 RepID=UPI00315B8D43